MNYLIFIVSSVVFVALNPQEIRGILTYSGVRLPTRNNTCWQFMLSSDVTCNSLVTDEAQGMP